MPLVPRVLAAVLAAAAGLAWGQGYPARTVKIVVPFAPAAWTSMRASSRKTAGPLGNRSSEDKPGGALIGTDAVAERARRIRCS
jgi:hypothetical protein